MTLTSEINFVHHKNNLKKLNDQMYLVQRQIKHKSIEKKNITDQSHRKQNIKIKVILKSICQTLLYGIQKQLKLITKEIIIQL